MNPRRSRLGTVAVSHASGHPLQKTPTYPCLVRGGVTVSLKVGIKVVVGRQQGEGLTGYGGMFRVGAATFTLGLVLAEGPQM